MLPSGSPWVTRFYGFVPLPPPLFRLLRNLFNTLLSLCGKQNLPHRTRGYQQMRTKIPVLLVNRIRELYILHRPLNQVGPINCLTSAKRSLAPFTTFGCPVNPSVQFTNPTSFTIRVTRSRSPRSSEVNARKTRTGVNAIAKGPKEAHWMMQAEEQLVKAWRTPFCFVFE